MLLRFCISIMITALLPISAYSQLKIFLPKLLPDSNYIKSYFNEVTTRVFIEDKYNSFAVAPRYSGDSYTRYRTNKPMSIGIGGVYKIYNFNLGIGLPMNHNFKEEYGKSRVIDLQSSIYGQRWVFDIFFQFYKGFYTKNNLPEGMNVAIKPNLRMNTIGGTAHYLFNNGTFSYRAFRINDEWQQKTSGTFMATFSLIGNEIYDKDSIGFVPKYDDNVFRKQSLQIGPGIGYARNFIINKHWFLLMSFNARAVWEFGTEYITTNHKIKNSELLMGLTVLGAIGYQNEKWGINLSGYDAINWNHSGFYNAEYRVDIGYVRLAAVYRLNKTNFVKKILRPFDYLLEK